MDMDMAGFVGSAALTIALVAWLRADMRGMERRLRRRRPGSTVRAESAVDAPGWKREKGRSLRTGETGMKKIVGVIVAIATAAIAITGCEESVDKEYLERLQRAAQAKDIVIEPDARMGLKFMDQGTTLSVEMIEAAIAMIELLGWRCDSISSAITLRSRYRFVCNRHAYVYSIMDRGGQWIVELE